MGDEESAPAFLEPDLNRRIAASEYALIPDALWWGVVTLTTVGYGDVFPVTPEGRLAAGGLMILGITLFAAITGTIMSALVVQGAGTARSDADRLRDITALRDEGLLTDEEYARKREELVERL